MLTEPPPLAKPAAHLPTFHEIAIIEMAKFELAAAVDPAASLDARASRRAV
jgi:hypothetical protein